MNQRAMILHALRDGPGTSRELSDETGMPPRQVSAILSTLHKSGRLNRWVYARRREHGSKQFLYEVVA